MEESKGLEISKKLNLSVFKVLGEGALVGFEKAYQVAIATQQLKDLLTPEYMKPIMQLQGNRLGFKTDKDTTGGYPEVQVKNCLIEAVLMGVQPSGNEFNIIAGNCYLTKEGIGSLLKKIEGLSYDIVHELPRINATNTSAAVTAKISWNYLGNRGEKKIEIPVKMNSLMGTDAVLGKATRKARKWLYDTLTGSELPEGDVMDLDAKVISSSPLKSKEESETERIELMIHDCKTVDDLMNIEPHITTPELKKLYTTKSTEITGS